MINHLDLFSGIGGFSYAADEVWGKGNVRHIFCDNDKYCQAVTKRHWPESEHCDDIRELIRTVKMERIDTNTQAEGCDSIGEMVGTSEGIPERRKDTQGTFERELVAHAKCEGRRQTNEIQTRRNSAWSCIDIITGGFPCQPFSHAGNRRGKSDDRFLWPEMLECIRLFQPRWVIAENVYGLLSIESGMVFEQVCLDLEGEGYEVWPLIIPACAVNSPHRRDRVWIVAFNSERSRSGIGLRTDGKVEKINEGWQEQPMLELGQTDCDAPNYTGKGLERQKPEGRSSSEFDRGDWQADWREVAAATCIRGVDDGIPKFMDEVCVSTAKQRVERVKMLGNAIVPQVVVEIMKAIKELET